MKWNIRHGIASCIEVTSPDGKQWTAIWMNDTDGAEWHRSGRMSPTWFDPPDVPKVVQDVVERRFMTVFSLPYPKRESYCLSGRSIECEA